MKDRALPLGLLLCWQAAMVPTTCAGQGLLGALCSLVVGMTLIVLLVGSAEREAAGAAEASAFEHLAFSIPAH